MGFTWKGLGKKLKPLAKAAKIAAPIAGFALGPGVGLALGAASGLGHGKKSLGKMAGGAALGGAGALVGKLANVNKLGVLGGLKNLGGKAGSLVGKAGSLAGKAGKFAGAINPDGSLNMQNLMGLGLAGAAFKGNRDDSKKAESFNASNALLRQQLMERLSKSPDYSALMERITARPNYNLGN